MTIGQNSVGPNFAEVFTAGSVQQFPDFELGTRAKSGDGKEYIFVQANGAIVANDVVFIDEAFQADQLETTVSATAFGQAVGVAGVAFADNDYGWVQIYGACTVNVGASAATNTALNTTATAGRVDDDATTGAEVVSGLVTTAAESSNAAAGWLNYPTVGATL